MQFYDFMGNDGAKALLAGAFDSGRVPHAFLIDGPAGSGKKMLARIIAAAAVCESEGDKPCGKCRQCLNAFSAGHADITSYSGTGSARSFSVDTVRKIRMDAYIAPNDADRKVYILADIQQMTEQAQNALLKILEEPPPFTLFILTCEGKSRILPTVLSRAQLLTVGPVSEEEAVEALMKRARVEGRELNREDAVKAARLSGYRVGRAQSGLESGAIHAAAALCSDFAQAICGSRQYQLLKLSGMLEKNGALYSAFLELLPELLRDAVTLKAAAGKPGAAVSLLSGCEEPARKICSGIPTAKIFRMLETSLWARGQAERYANTTLLLTAFFARLWRDAH